MTAAFPIDSVRAQFPGLQREVAGRPAIFFDGPAGSQTPRRVVEAVSDYLLHRNANHGGPFATSQESDAMLAEAHRALADFVGAERSEEVSFGANMTTLTFALSRALARTWKAGDEILVSRLDHDANLLLCFFVGFMGIHRFYVGKIGTGLLQLVTFGGLGIWTLVDFVMIVVGCFTDKDGNPIKANN